MAEYNKTGLTSAAVGRKRCGPSYSRPDDPGTGTNGTVDQAGLNNNKSEHEVVNETAYLPVHARVWARQEVWDRPA